MFFFLRNSSPLPSISRSSSFFVIHLIVNIKNNVEEDTTLLLFFLSKSPGGRVISLQINLELHLGCYSLWCGRAVGQEGGRAYDQIDRDHQIGY